MFGKYLRARLNRAVSARVDSQMDRQASETARLFDVVQRMQRVITEMSTSVADRLVALEASVLTKDEE